MNYTEIVTKKLKISVSNDRFHYPNKKSYSITKKHARYINIICRCDVIEYESEIEELDGIVRSGNATSFEKQYTHDIINIKTQSSYIRSWKITDVQMLYISSDGVVHKWLSDCSYIRMDRNYISDIVGYTYDPNIGSKIIDAYDFDE